MSSVKSLWKKKGRDVSYDSYNGTQSRFDHYVINSVDVVNGSSTLCNGIHDFVMKATAAATNNSVPASVAELLSPLVKGWVTTSPGPYHYVNGPDRPGICNSKKMSRHGGAA